MPAPAMPIRKVSRVGEACLSTLPRHRTPRRDKSSPGGNSGTAPVRCWGPDLIRGPAEVSGREHEESPPGKRGTELRKLWDPGLVSPQPQASQQVLEAAGQADNRGRVPPEISGPGALGPGISRTMKTCPWYTRLCGFADRGEKAKARDAWQKTVGAAARDNESFEAADLDGSGWRCR